MAQMASGLSSALNNVLTSALKAKQMELSQKQQSQKDLLNLVSSTHPIQTISETLNQKQAQQIEQLTNSWSDIYRQRQGKLTTQDMMKINQDKQKFQTWQGGIMAGQKEASDAIERIKVQPDKWDSDYTLNSVAQFMETGIKPEGGFLDVAPADLAKVYGKYSMTGDKNISVVDKGGKKITTAQYNQLPDDQLDQYADYEMFQSPDKALVQKSILRGFQSLPAQEQQKYAQMADQMRQQGINVNAFQLYNRREARKHYKQDYGYQKTEPVKSKTGGSWKYMYGKDNLSWDDVLSSEMKTVETASGMDAIPFVDEVSFGKKINHDFVAGEYYDMTSSDKNSDNTRDVRLTDVSIKYIPFANGKFITKSQLESGEYDRNNAELKGFFYGTKYSQQGNSRPVAIPLNDANLKAIGAKLGQDLSGVKKSLSIKDKQVQKEINANTALPSAASKYGAKKPSWIPFR